jgi:transaldolase
MGKAKMTAKRRSLFYTTICLLWQYVHTFTPEMRGKARFFLDTADPNEWDKWLPTGIFTGVTTNPLLLERAQQPCTVPHLHTLCHRALQHVDEIMVQTWAGISEDAVAAMYQRGMELSAPSRDKIVIKVPTTFEGTQVASQLIQSGCRVCLTVGYDPPKQALLATTVGAEYLAPYHGRLADQWQSPTQATQACIHAHQVVQGLKGHTRILVASLRSTDTLVELAAAGLDTFTFSPDVAAQLFDTPATETAARDFEAAALRMSSGL